MKKLLYIDLPFAGEKGGDKNRSKFIWKALTSHYEVHYLVLQHWKVHNFTYELPADCKIFFELKTAKPSISAAESIFNFKSDQLAKFSSILKKYQYDVVFIRFASPAMLVTTVHSVLAKAKIVIDIDMVFSRLSELSWQTNPTFKNRFFYIENKKLNRFEKKLFNLSCLFLFTNYLEKDMVIKKYVRSSAEGQFKTLPNVMQPSDYLIPEERKKYILFFGALNSAANKDAFEFICNDIYPLIRNKLTQQKVKLRIVGKNQLPMHQEAIEKGNMEMIDLVGEVDDIDKEIAESQFVILPIRIASGTRTRILEAANLKTAVVSTTIGAEGFEFSPEEIIIGDEAQQLANEINKLLDDPDRCKSLGDKLLKKSHELYLDSVVAQNLVQEIEEYGA